MPFFEDGDEKDPAVQEIKWKVFGVAADGNILDDKHPIAQALVQLPAPVTDGPLCAISGCVNLPVLIELCAIILQVNSGHCACLKPRKMHRKDLNRRAANLVSYGWATAMRRVRRQYWIFSVSCLYVLEVSRLL